jgi:HEAT repeat protein
LGAVRALRKFDDSAAIEALLVAQSDHDSTVRDAAKSSFQFGRKGDLYIEGLISALRHSDSDVRASAAYHLGEVGAVSAVDALLDALTDGDPGMNAPVLRALSMIGDARAYQPLVLALGDKSPYMRGEVAAGLGRIGDPRAVDPLIVALQDHRGDEEWHAVASAARALGMIGDPRAVEPLVASLQDPGWERSLFGCREVAVALGKIGDPRAIEHLVTFLSSMALPKCQDWGAFQASAEALKQLGWQPDTSTAGAAYWAARMKWKSAARIGPAAAPLLVYTLRKGDLLREDGRELIVVLGKMGAPAIQALQGFRSDSDWRIDLAREAFDLALAAERTAPTRGPLLTELNRFKGSGICDVCNASFSRGKAYLVPVDVFYGSSKYKEHLRPLAEMLGGGDVDAYVARMRQSDPTDFSAVCAECISLFT